MKEKEDKGKKPKEQEEKPVVQPQTVPTDPPTGNPPKP